MEEHRSPRGASRSPVVWIIALGTALVSGPASGEGPADDGVAPGAVAFFGIEATACPDGWAPVEDAAGRILVGAVDAPAVGRQVGTPLADQEDRTHEHAFSATVDLPYKAIAAADGANDQGAAAQAYTVEGTTGPAATGLPFIQLLVCEKQ